MPARAVALVALFAFAAAACSADAPPSGEVPSDFEPIGTLSSGEALPEATLPVLAAATSVTTSQLRGTPLVVNFWATWCAFCVEEMPDFEEVHRAVGDRVRFIGVDREDVPERALELAQRTGVTYELLEDRDGSFFRAVGGRGMPTTLLVAADGRVAYRHAGPLDAEQLRGLIRDHLGI